MPLPVRWKPITSGARKALPICIESNPYIYGGYLCVCVCVYVRKVNSFSLSLTALPTALPFFPFFLSLPTHTHTHTQIHSCVSGFVQSNSIDAQIFMWRKKGKRGRKPKKQKKGEENVVLLLSHPDTHSPSPRCQYTTSIQSPNNQPPSTKFYTHFFPHKPNRTEPKLKPIQFGIARMGSFFFEPPPPFLALGKDLLSCSALAVPFYLGTRTRKPKLWRYKKNNNITRT